MPWSTATAIPSCKGGNVHLTLKRREAPSAPPLGELLSECEAEGVRYEILVRHQDTDDTPSGSPFGLPAPSLGEPRVLLFCGIVALLQQTDNLPGQNHRQQRVGNPAQGDVAQREQQHD